jgi:hypothetical protein
MPELFADDIHGVQVPCSSCGTIVELANTGLSAFESPESVLCLDCLIHGGALSLRAAEPSAMTLPAMSLQERIALIDEVVASFSVHLRNVLVRSVKSDLTWNGEYRFENWDNPADALASAHAPGIWYALRPQDVGPRS